MKRCLLRIQVALENTEATTIDCKSELAPTTDSWLMGDSHEHIGSTGRNPATLVALGRSKVFTSPVCLPALCLSFGGHMGECYMHLLELGLLISHNMANNLSGLTDS